MLHGLAIFFGLSNASGRAYLWWSGIGADLSELTIIAGAVAIFRKHTCQEPRCIRLGHFEVEGTPFKACWKHHPGIDRKPTKGHMAEAFKLHKAKQAQKPDTL